MCNSMMMFFFSIFASLVQKSIWHFDVNWLNSQPFICRDLKPVAFLVFVIKTNFNVNILYKLLFCRKTIPCASDFKRYFFTLCHIIPLPTSVLSQFCFILIFQFFYFKILIFHEALLLLCCLTDLVYSYI